MVHAARENHETTSNARARSASKGSHDPGVVPCLRCGLVTSMNLRCQKSLACAAGSFLLLLVVPLSPLLAQDMPAWKFREGSSFTLENVHHLKQAVTIKDKVQKSELTTTWTTRIDVRKVSDKQVILEQTIVSVAAKGVADKGDFDAWAAKLQGNKFRFTLSPAGRVLHLEGYEDFVKKVEGVKHEAEHVARSLVSELALRQTLEDMLGFLPEKPVQPKMAWQHEAVESIAPFGSIKIDFHYTLAGRRAGADVIAFTMQGSYVPPKDNLGVLTVLKGTIKSGARPGRNRLRPTQGHAHSRRKAIDHPRRSDIGRRSRTQDQHDLRQRIADELAAHRKGDAMKDFSVLFYAAVLESPPLQDEPVRTAVYSAFDGGAGTVRLAAAAGLQRDAGLRDKAIQKELSPQEKARKAEIEFENNIVVFEKSLTITKRNVGRFRARSIN